MAHAHDQGSGSRIAIRGHPLHPLLVPLPIGMLVAALCGDIAYAFSADAFWARGAFWLLAGGGIAGAVAALGGVAELAAVRRARRSNVAWAHGIGNLGALALVAANVAIRSRDPVEAVIPAGLLISVVTVLILGVTAWLGGELTYRHGIGVSPEVGGAAPDEARR